MALAVTNRPINTDDPRGCSAEAALSDDASQRFLLALHEHYGPDLAFSSACVLDRQHARGDARKPYTARVASGERELDAFFGAELRRGGFAVLNAGRDGAGRTLWRVRGG